MDRAGDEDRERMWAADVEMLYETLARYQGRSYDRDLPKTYYIRDDEATAAGGP